MANTFSQLYIHIVFAVKGRQNQIKQEWKDELYKYITGIVKAKKQKLFAINGMPDHIHILISISPDISLSSLARDIKANSSKFINEKKFLSGKFYWQTGFGAFSCSQSHIDKVINYINSQENHHKKKSFREEYIQLLKKYNVDFNEKYIFELDE